MSETIKDVIARLKAKQGIAQQSAPQDANVVARPVGRPPKVEVPIKEEELDAEEDAILFEEDEEIPKAQEKPAVKPSNEVAEAIPQITEAQKEQILMEIEMLQNNGRYRAEMLHQLNEINKALVVIAGVLVEKN